MNTYFGFPMFDDLKDVLEITIPSHCQRRIPRNNSEEIKEYCKKKCQSKKAKANHERCLIPTVEASSIIPISGFGRSDMHETDSSYDLLVDLPGLEKSDVLITAEDNTLTIKCERKQKKEEEGKDGKYHFIERHYGSFQREIKVPKDANCDSINAMYENGVLRVTIPKCEPISRKTIIVN